MLEGLNERQREAVLHGEGPLLVYAGAGSGKTRVLTTRIAHLISDRGVHPNEVLALTFTNKAAGEMKERLSGLVGPAAKEIWASTFHSACLRILKLRAATVGLCPGFSIYDEDDTRKAVRNATTDAGYDPKDLAVGITAAHISAWKNRLVTPKKAWSSATSEHETRRARVFEHYQRLLAEANSVDFDDLLVLTVRLLSEHRPVLEEYRDKFHWIFVDEYQDTNIAQNEIIRLLAGRSPHNLTVVGDPDQSIYGWRGAEMRNLLSFPDMFGGCHTVTLDRNYRSTKKILEAANAVIENNVERPKKNLWTDTDGGAQIVVECLNTGDDEAHWVASQVRRLIGRGVRGGDIAILCRLRAIAEDMERALLESQIPVHLVGGVGFLERAAVRDVLAYARLVVNPDDDVAFRRVVNTPPRKIGDASVKKIRSFAKFYAQGIGDACNRVEEIGLPNAAALGLTRFSELLAAARQTAAQSEDASAAIQSVVAGSGYKDYVSTLGEDVARGKLRDVDEVVDMARAFKTVESFLEEVALMSDTDDLDEDGRRVLIMTVHASKGLEFTNVFVPGMEEGLFPSTRSEEIEELEEERRLAYVAITRARQRLYLSHAYTRTLWGKWMRNDPSRFLDEVPGHLVVPSELAS